LKNYYDFPNLNDSKADWKKANYFDLVEMTKTELRDERTLLKRALFDGASGFEVLTDCGALSSDVWLNERLQRVLYWQEVGIRKGPSIKVAALEEGAD